MLVREGMSSDPGVKDLKQQGKNCSGFKRCMMFGPAEADSERRWQ